MSAGLPGLGLGGLFFIFSALLAPFRELWRTLRGRSRPAAWRIVGRQFAQAAVMVAAIDLTLRLIYVGLSTMGLGNAPSAVTGTVIPLTLIGMTSALLVAVLGAAKIAELAVRLRTAELPRLPDALPRPTPLRALTLGGTATVAWLALFAAGSGNEPASGVSSPNAMGPPATAGPPEGSPVPEHPGSSPHAGPG